MTKSAPNSVAFDHDDDIAGHIGHFPDGRQFFLTTPFEPAGSGPGKEFVAGSHASLGGLAKGVANGISRSESRRGSQFVLSNGCIQSIEITPSGETNHARSIANEVARPQPTDCNARLYFSAH